MTTCHPCRYIIQLEHCSSSRKDDCPNGPNLDYRRSGPPYIVQIQGKKAKTVWNLWCQPCKRTRERDENATANGLQNSLQLLESQCRFCVWHVPRMHHAGDVWGLLGAHRGPAYSTHLRDTSRVVGLRGPGTPNAANIRE